MFEMVTTAILLIVYLLVVIAYGRRRVREKEARESMVWPDEVPVPGHEAGLN